MLKQFIKRISNFYAPSIILVIFQILFASHLMAQPGNMGSVLFSNNWEFIKDFDQNVEASLFKRESGLNWQKIELPHTASLEPVVYKGPQWQGTCVYRKFFTPGKEAAGKQVAVLFEAAMHQANVYLNGQPVYHHEGGYLPFYVDITKALVAGKENCILVKLNNNDNAAIPPGKPIAGLDFNYYSGIYRNAYLLLEDALHISNAVQANQPAGGGILVQEEKVSEALATLQIKTSLQNNAATGKVATLKLVLKDATGIVVASASSTNVTCAAGGFTNVLHQLVIKNPRLWNSEKPYRYQLIVELLADGKKVDGEQLMIGIRDIAFKPDGFYLNGKKTWLRGTNRHQEYPYIGYALSNNANYRDAWLIKSAGFNFVRCSHYPPSPAFLDACDELGIMVMDAIPGWQFFGKDSFLTNSFQNIRDMIRRDRNHPSIILWEASLNESSMSREYMDKANEVAHAELPFNNVFTAGWKDAAYDVFVPARQHGKAPEYWKKYNKNKSILIAEYGDWEYYAQNAGFDQGAYKDLNKEERTSRQLRGDGEKRLLQQAYNYQESHNDNLRGQAAGDANWVMFDYKRGYAPDIESSGIMDIFRLPKFAYYFYQSQAGPAAQTSGLGRPMVFIASYNLPESSRDVLVYSNCDEVALYNNNQLVARQKPDTNYNSTNLGHPPFTFKTAGTGQAFLKAVGYIAGKASATFQLGTPTTAAAIRLTAATNGKVLQAGTNDIIFLYASVVDKNGVNVPAANNQVTFTITGDATMVGENPIATEAGIATILVKAGKKPGKITIQARSGELKTGELVIQAK